VKWSATVKKGRFWLAFIARLLLLGFQERIEVRMRWYVTYVIK